MPKAVFADHEVQESSMRARSYRYLGLGRGAGLGTPVVSYAPLPMLTDEISLVIIWNVGCKVCSREHDQYSNSDGVLYILLLSEFRSPAQSPQAQAREFCIF